MFGSHIFALLSILLLLFYRLCMRLYWKMFVLWVDLCVGCCAMFNFGMERDGNRIISLRMYTGQTSLYEFERSLMTLET